MGLRWRPTRILGLLFLLVTGAALTGCAESLPQTPFDPQGPVAKMQLDLLDMSLWVVSGIGIVVSVALLYVVFRFRHKGNEKSVPAQVHGNTKLEILWTLIPILIVASVAVPTVKTAFSTYEPPTKDAMVVRAIGNQWWFAFEYPEYGVVTANELYIPVGKPVKLELTSNDVIHSFWVPKLAGKVDLIPGRINQMWMQADKADLYYGQCAEFCGSSHAKMRFRVHAVSQQEFDAWIATRKAGAVQPTEAVAVKGKALFEGEGGKAACWSCHAIDGSSKAKGTVGPNLSNIGARATIAAGVLENTEEHLRQWIRNPQSIKPDARMPQHAQLSDEELTAIITYLRSLNK